MSPADKPKATVTTADKRVTLPSLWPLMLRAVSVGLGVFVVGYAVNLGLLNDNHTRDILVAAIEGVTAAVLMAVTQLLAQLAPRG